MGFQAIVLTQNEARATQAQLQTVERDQLPQVPQGEVHVAVSHSTLNFKDGLAMLGRNGVVRSFPMVPGIDLAGTVISSQDARALTAKCRSQAATDVSRVGLSTLSQCDSTSARTRPSASIRLTVPAVWFAVSSRRPSAESASATGERWGTGSAATAPVRAAIASVTSVGRPIFLMAWAPSRGVAGRVLGLTHGSRRLPRQFRPAVR